MGFAHFAVDSANAGSIRRRTGESLVDVKSVAVRGDSVVLTGAGEQSIDAAWHGDTLTGVMLAKGKPSGRMIRFVRRSGPFVAEKRMSCGRAR